MRIWEKDNSSEYPSSKQTGISLRPQPFCDSFSLIIAVKILIFKLIVFRKKLISIILFESYPSLHLFIGSSEIELKTRNHGALITLRRNVP